MIKRTAFFVSEGTGITVESLGNSLLAQFSDSLECDRRSVRFLKEKNLLSQVCDEIEEAYKKSGERPLVFETVLDSELHVALERTSGIVFDVFGHFLAPLEIVLGVKSNHSLNHKSGHNPRYSALYRQRAAGVDLLVKQLEQQRNQLAQRLKAAEQDNKQAVEGLQDQLEANKRERERLQKLQDQYQKKEAVLEELATAIEPMMDAISSDKATVKSYKWQSKFLLSSAIACFTAAVGLIFWRVFLIDIEASSSYQLLMQIGPGFVLAFLGAALLRHDWKIRQLTLGLIDQNNAVDIAMGTLTAALKLSNIGKTEFEEGIPELLQESFREVRRALLYRNRGKGLAGDNESSQGNDLDKIVRTLNNNRNSATA